MKRPDFSKSVLVRDARGNLMRLYGHDPAFDKAIAAGAKLEERGGAPVTASRDDGTAATKGAQSLSERMAEKFKGRGGDKANAGAKSLSQAMAEKFGKRGANG